MKSWSSQSVTIYNGNCLDVLKELPSNSVDSVITEPPYHLTQVSRGGSPRKPNPNHPAGRHRLGDKGFMGKTWDGGDFAFRPELWAEVLRVAKPGATLLAFGGTRTFHRLTCAIEDGGWEIRDCMMWLYGCLDEQTEILTENGWRSYSQVAVGDRVAAWNSATEEISLQSVRRVNVAPYVGEMVRFSNDNTDQLLTPNHRVYKRHAVREQQSGRRKRFFEKDWNVKNAGDINRWQPIKLPLAGYNDGPGIGGEAFAELLGWVWTEGGFDKCGSGVRITQTSANPEHIDAIRSCLVCNGISFKHYERERSYRDRIFTEHTWFFSGDAALAVRKHLPHKHPSWSLLWEMSLAEKRAFLDAAMRGDDSGTAFYQKDDRDREWFQAMLHCMGMQGRDNPRKHCIAIHDNPTTELQRRHLKNDKTPYAGLVWCVTVASGAFVARRNGKVFITGNSGFPKSINISKAIDDSFGAERPVVGFDPSRARPNRTGPVMGDKAYNRSDNGATLTEAATPEAKLWSGYGSALKPSWEPIVVAMKPLDGTFAGNALKWGVAGLNIDECRIAVDPVLDASQLRTMNRSQKDENNGWGMNANSGDKPQVVRPEGRFPANLLLDEEAAALLDQQTGTLKSGTNCVRRKDGTFLEHGGMGKPGDVQITYGDAGGASRFFYVGKAKPSEKNEGLPVELQNKHPTVKPLALMEYLCKLTKTPTGGVVLDPFQGSGTTGVAAIRTGRAYIGIDLEEDNFAIAQHRLQHALNKNIDLLA